ncbi:hypothetical protein V5O48_018794 [Marasmius crinis-equi]|uniref:HNH nuclease domain-containing protein n=1 Tax=Marasmius crinis-equi TaxID=585013 RepID=A0ABR3EK71_9AGAR
MTHLSRRCNGKRKCLNTWSRRVSTTKPASTLPILPFLPLDVEQRGLLHIAARVVPHILGPYDCHNPKNGIHFVKLVQDDDLCLKVIREATLVECACDEVIHIIPKTLTSCIMSGWEAWKEVCEEERVNYGDVDLARADSPDLPDLAELGRQCARSGGKRKCEELEGDSDSGEGAVNEAESSSKRACL